MPTSKTYAIFWLPPRVNGRINHYEPGGSDASYEATVRGYFQDVGATPYYGVLTQYSTWNNKTVSSGPINNSSTLTGWLVDRSGYGHKGTKQDPVREADIRAEVSRAMRLKGWTAGSDKEFFVYLGYGVQMCHGGGPFHWIESCTASNGDAGYHSEATVDGRALIYSAISDFKHGGSPRPAQLARNATYVTSHEQFEAVTDPKVVNPCASLDLYRCWGWTEGELSEQHEVADVCEGNFGKLASDDTNVELAHGHRYLVALIWSNKANACVTAPNTAGSIMRIRVPGVGGGLDGLAPSSNGGVWFLDPGGRIGKASPSGRFREFSLPPTDKHTHLFSLAPAPNGGALVGDLDQIDHITSNGKIRVVKLHLLRGDPWPWRRTATCGIWIMTLW